MGESLFLAKEKHVKVSIFYVLQKLKNKGRLVIPSVLKGCGRRFGSERMSLFHLGKAPEAQVIWCSGLGCAPPANGAKGGYLRAGWLDSSGTASGLVGFKKHRSVAVSDTLYRTGAVLLSGPG